LSSSRLGGGPGAGGRASESEIFRDGAGGARDAAPGRGKPGRGVAFMVAVVDVIGTACGHAGSPAREQMAVSVVQVG
jgi:hypothetical protein